MAKRSPKKNASNSAPAADVEQRLEQLQNDLAWLKQQVRQTQRLASLGTSAAALAHEMNNMLTPVVGYAKFALDRNDPALMQKALHTALAQADVLKTMAERVLGMAIDRPVSFQSTRLADIVNAAVHCLCRDLRKDGIRLIIDTPNDLHVWADAHQLQQVFFNLLINARDAIGQAVGAIDIEASTYDDHFVRVTVSDNGCGIAPEHLDSIFDAFFSTKRADGGNGRRGSGLGLAVSREIIDEHRGTISVTSTVGHGTTFAILLPTTP